MEQTFEDLPKKERKKLAKELKDVEKKKTTRTSNLVKYTLFGLIVVVTALIGYFYFSNYQKSQGSLDYFAKCLTQKGVKFYGAFWCPHCQAEKRLFGESEKYLNYIECSNADQTQNETCSKAKIESYPTFEFSNGERVTGEVSLDDLSAKTGCSISEPITPTPTPAVSPVDAYHIHADFKVFVDNQTVDFSKTQYQSKDSADLDTNIHLHDGNGNIIHIHKKGTPLAELFKSFGGDFTNSCLTYNSKDKFCNQSDKTLKLYVNGKIDNQFGNYIPNDLDQILITFGNEPQNIIDTELKSVTNDACIYSNKCPERGKPPSEDCITGKGCPAS